MNYTSRELAFRIALRYPRSIPTAKQLMAAFGLERSTAHRYAADYRRARGFA